MCFELYQKSTHTGKGMSTKNKNSHHEPCRWSKTHCDCFSRIKPRCTRELSTLLDVQLYLCFFFNQRFSVRPPYAPYMHVNARRDPRHPPHRRQRHNSKTHICLLRGGRTKLLRRRIDRAYLDFGCSRCTAICGPWCKLVSVCRTRRFARRAAFAARYACPGRKNRKMM